MVESPRRVGSLSYGQGGRLARLYKQIIILAVLPLAHLQTLHMNMCNIFHIASGGSLVSIMHWHWTDFAMFWAHSYPGESYPAAPPSSHIYKRPFRSSFRVHLRQACS